MICVQYIIMYVCSWHMYQWYVDSWHACICSWHVHILMIHTYSWYVCILDTRVLMMYVCSWHICVHDICMFSWYVFTIYVFMICVFMIYVWVHAYHSTCVEVSFLLPLSWFPRTKLSFPALSDFTFWAISPLLDF